MSGKTGAASAAIISAVFLSGFAVIKCGPGNDITVLLKSGKPGLLITAPGGSRTVLDESSPEAVLKILSGTARERTYRFELTGDICKDVSFNVRCGKNGGWYIAEKFLLGGIIGIMVIDCSKKELWILPPDSLDGKSGEVKATAMITEESDELSLVLKSSVPGEIFNSIPFTKLTKSI